MGNPNSVVLENTPLLDRYAELVRIGQDLNEDLTTVEALFAKLCLRAAAITDVQDFLMLAIYQPQTQTLDRYIYEQGTYRNSNDPIDERCQQILTTKQPLRISGSLPQQAGQKSAIYLPLLWGDTALGVLAVQNALLNVYNVYTDEDVQVLQLLANHVALAITWIDLFRSLQQLSMTGQLLTQQLTTDLLLPKIAEEIKTATKADLIALYPYHQGSNQFRLPPTLGGTLLAPDALQPTILTPDAIPALAVQLTTAKFIPDSQELYAQMGGKSAHYIPSFVNHEQICSTAVVPLRIHAEAVGVMFVNFRHPQRFNAPQRELIQGLASYAAIAMRNSREFDAVAQRRAEELHILQEVDRQISATLDLEKVLQVLVELTAQYIHADDGCVLLYNQRLHRLEAKAAVGYSTQINLKQIIPLDGNKGITRWVFEHRASVLVHDFSQEPAWDAVRVVVDRQTRSELDVPLTDREGNCIGVMNFESRRVGAFTPENRQFLEILAGQAVLAIQNAQTYEREKRLAEDREALIAIARKEAERRVGEAELFASMGESAFLLTHRLGNDLGLVRTYVNEIRLLLQERGFTVDQALQTEFDHILTDVGKVLKFSADLKQQLGVLREGVAKSTVAVATLLEAIDTQLPPIPEHIKLHKEPFSAEAKVDVVVGQIGSIIHNLVSNAIEAMPNGGAITLRTRVDNQAVEIEVSDTGPGIDASDQNKIFNLFYSTKETSGFGLWNARRRALEHGGNLIAQSHPGHGATFQLVLPRSDV